MAPLWDTNIYLKSYSLRKDSDTESKLMVARGEGVWRTG